MMRNTARNLKKSVFLIIRVNRQTLTQLAEQSL